MAGSSWSFAGRRRLGLGLHLLDCDGQLPVFHSAVTAFLVTLDSQPARQANRSFGEWRKAEMTLPELVERVEQWKRCQPDAEVVRFVGELFGRYLETGQDDRGSIRQAVVANRELWNVLGDDDICLYLNRVARDQATGIEQNLRGWLIAVSLTGGCADWRDTIVVLSKVREYAETKGIATRMHFEQIAATADDENTHGISEMSTRDLIWAAADPNWFEGERSNKADASSRGQPKAASQPHRPWWRFWT
jgi:hypothetical protein